MFENATLEDLQREVLRRLPPLQGYSEVALQAELDRRRTHKPNEGYMTFASRFLDVPIATLIGGGQCEEVASPRHVAMTVLHKNLGKSNRAVARAFHRTGHSCVAHARSQVEARDDLSSLYDAMVVAWNARKSDRV